MAQLTYPGGSVEIDDNGFLVNLDDWNEGVAKAVAAREGIDKLDEEMMEVIRFMRSYYMKFKAFPILNYVCKNVDQPRNCVSDEFINPEKAWKIAGLPKLAGVHFISTDGKHYVMEAPT